MAGHRCSRIPEIPIAFSCFFLNFFWEVLQTYFYALRDVPFRTMLYGWIHCTFGDVLLTIISFWLISLASQNRKWFFHLNRLNLGGFVLVGIIFTIISERVNIHVLRSWTYNQSMPLIPFLEVGLTPLLQWLMIPPFIILLVRHHLLSHSAAEEG